MKMAGNHTNTIRQIAVNLFNMLKCVSLRTETMVKFLPCLVEENKSIPCDFT